MFQKPRPASYELTKAEQAYDCPKLTGHMKLRIAVIGGTADRQPTSTVSHVMQKMATPVIGSTEQGVDANADLAYDRSMLEAYNAQLVAKQCTPLDIDGELAGRSTPNGGKSTVAKSTAKPASSQK